MCRRYKSRYAERDLTLPKHRKNLLDKAVFDLSSDSNVLAIYLGGSLAKENYDAYSDIDLHTIVKSEKKMDFIRNKRRRTEKWGQVLFHEDPNPQGPVVVSHFVSFVKVDSWYHTFDELLPSIWLKNLKVLYDPSGSLEEVLQKSSNLSYKLEAAEVELWKAKVLAFAHEIYRAVMREEMLYAEYNLDRLRWLVVSGWFKEIDEHFDASYGSWSKVQGKRSILNIRQLTLLGNWECGKNADEIMITLKNMIPEILRLHHVLNEKIGIEVNEERFRNILEMSY